jgi:Icc-related predicted phosphoesterase
MTLNAVIFGDLHCRFDDVERVADEIDRSEPPLCIFVGDFGFGDRRRIGGMDPRKWPFVDGRSPDEVLAPLVSLGCRFLYILGNHDHDNEDQYLPVVRSRALHWTRNLDGRVVEVDGVRIAGLGGTFKQKAWMPGGDAPYESAAHYLERNPKKVWHFRNPWAGHVQPHAKDRMNPGDRGSIFFDEFQALRGLQADVLVTHEPPGSDYVRSVGASCWDVISDLAQDMGAKAIIHGHVHHDYEETLDNGITVFGRGLAHGTFLDLGRFRPDFSDDRQMHYA